MTIDRVLAGRARCVAVSGERDTIDCGNEVFDGTDVAHIDEGLDVTQGCELEL